MVDKATAIHPRVRPGRRSPRPSREYRTAQVQFKGSAVCGFTLQSVRVRCRTRNLPAHLARESATGIRIPIRKIEHEVSGDHPADWYIAVTATPAPTGSGRFLTSGGIELIHVTIFIPLPARCGPRQS